MSLFTTLTLFSKEQKENAKILPMTKSENTSTERKKPDLSGWIKAPYVRGGDTL
jgi:hypothetical protein